MCNLRFIVFFYLLLQVHSIKYAEGDVKSSLVFVFDITGSMHDDLEQLREGAELILDAVLQNEATQIYNFVLVPFGDPDVGPSTITTDKDQFQAALNDLSLHGGGNCPEMSLTGIQMALNDSLPNSFIYVFTDASSTDHYLVNTILDLVQRKQSQIVFIVTGDCRDREEESFKVYERISAASSGQIFNLRKTNVHDILDFVKDSISGRRVNLGSVVKQGGAGYTQDIPIDKQLNEVTVSISGSKPDLRILNPKGEMLTGPPRLVEAVNLEDVLVVKVIDPEPGNWSITVGSESDYSLKVTGTSTSNLTFRYGFSTEEPGSLDDTSHRPLQGTENYLMVSVLADQAVDIRYAEILSIDGQTLFELPFNLTDDANLISLPFLPPDQFFYVAISGFDENGNVLRRVGPTAVHPQLPGLTIELGTHLDLTSFVAGVNNQDKPFLTLSSTYEVHKHESVELRCAIESLVPVRASWSKSNKVLKKITSLQSTVLDYTISDVRDDDEGTYRCDVSNVAGSSKASTDLSILSDPPTVEVAPVDTVFHVNDSVQISCHIHSSGALLGVSFEIYTLQANESTEVNITESLDGNFEYTYNISLASKNDTGNYSCRATNKGGETIASTYITIAKPLKAHFIERYKSPEIGENIQLVCRIENGDSVEWFAPNGSSVASFNNIGLDNYDSVFHIHGADVDDEGMWRCVASNQHETVTDNMTLEVIIEPVLELDVPEDLTLIFGSNATITCKVTAKPEPKLVWIDANQNLMPIQLTKETDTLYIGEVTIPNINQSVEGMHYFESRNKVGLDSKSVRIRIWKTMAPIEVLEDMAVEIYSQASLACKIDAYPKVEIVWYHNDTEISSVSDNYSLRDDGTVLVINNASIELSGDYRCEVSNNYERKVFNAYLEIIGLEPPLIDKTNPTEEVLEGRNVTIPCRVLAGKPLPSVKWSFKGRNTQQFSPIRSDRSVTLTNVSATNAGLYRCEADNVLGIDNFDVELSVLYPPRVSETPSQIKANWSAGETVALSCEVDGLPKPLVAWTKDDAAVRYSSRVYLDYGKLMIVNLTEYDSGSYKCVAVNELGNITRNYSINVLVPPYIENGSQQTIDSVEGDLVELPCAVHGKPKPSVGWRHEGIIITENDNLQIDRQYTLRFVTNFTDSGEYVCMARNEYGVAEKIYFLNVWIPPSIAPPYDVDIQSVAGQSIVLRCDTTGFPTPSTKWTHNGKDVRLNTSVENWRINELGYLVIARVTSLHDGQYTCFTENIAGTASKNFSLTVNEPPVILPSNLTSPYIASSGEKYITLPCDAIGKPKPRILWYRGDTAIVRDSRFNISSDGSLTIKHPTSDLSGKYKCEAVNTAGTVEKVYEVNIYSRPRILTAMLSDESLINTAVEGENFTMQCPVQTSNGDTVLWYKDHSLIQRGNFNLPNVSRHNASTYTCIVSNPVGSVELQAKLNVEWPPQFIDNDNHTEVSVLAGNQVRLDCDVDAKPLPKLTWSFNAKPLVGEIKSTLLLEDVQIHDDGSYSCVVSNDHGLVSKYFRVHILVSPFFNDANYLKVHLMEGTNATLDCKAYGYPEPEITWDFNNISWEIHDNHLFGSQLSEEAEGNYTCNAINVAGTATLTYDVTVYYPAKITNITLHSNSEVTGISDVKEIEVMENTVTKLRCESHGKPPPKVQWLENGVVVSENENGIYFADITIRKTQMSHDSSVICLTTNEFGKDEKHIKMSFLEQPKIFKNIFLTQNDSETTIEVLEGQPFYLHCHPYGNPMPEVTWLQNGNPIINDTALTIQNDGQILVSQSATVNHVGNYTCSARNKVGEASITNLVSILESPKTYVLGENSSIKVYGIEGKNVNLSCLIKTNPASSVLWLRDPYTEIDLSNESRFELSEENATLRIANVTTSDSGIYTCVVYNALGATERTFNVLIEKPPHIVYDKEDSDAEEVIGVLKRVAILRCLVESYPPANITWLKGESELSRNLSHWQRSPDDSILVVSDLNVKDSGQYICVAQNHAGVDHRIYNLKVRVPGEWSPWSEWSYCNATCGLGAQHKTRMCQIKQGLMMELGANASIAEAYLVLDNSTCRGSDTETRNCIMPPCDEETSSELAGAGWSRWSAWSACSRTCGLASRSRTRQCRAPHRAACLGDNLQISYCYHLPKCETGDEDYNQEKYTEEQARYLPEAAFELQPEEQIDLAEDADASRLGSDDLEGSVYFTVDVGKHALRNNSGPCEDGFRYNELRDTCEDIDECLIENNQCHGTQTCHNTVGAYRCSCPGGFTSLGAGQRCLDINECEQGLDACEWACVNTAGGYVCACPRHLRLHADKRSCL